MGGVLVDYSDTYLGPYSPVRLSTLGSKTEYDAIQTVRGMRYKIWMNFNPAIPKEVWTTVYGGKHTQQLYREKWNQAYGNRFWIENIPAVDKTNGVLYFEGTSKSGETFGQLALDDAWARLHPWYAGTNLWQKLLQFGTGGIAFIVIGPLGWRGIEQVGYRAILDSSGKDVVAAAQGYIPDLPPGGDPGGDPGGLPGGDPFSGLTGGMPKIAGINILWIGAAAAVVGGAILLGRKKRG